jgi:hypothetical protein
MPDSASVAGTILTGAIAYLAVSLFYPKTEPKTEKPNCPPHFNKKSWVFSPKLP